jgi:predicted dinucleotide-binding enzyme
VFADNMRAQRLSADAYRIMAFVAGDDADAVRTARDLA